MVDNSLYIVGNTSFRQKLHKLSYQYLQIKPEEYLAAFIFTLYPGRS